MKDAPTYLCGSIQKDKQAQKVCDPRYLILIFLKIYVILSLLINKETILCVILMLKKKFLGKQLEN